MKTQCKSCSTQLSIPAKFIGRKILCPKCNTRVETGELKPLAECEHCWSEYKVKFELMGKRLMCPGCKKITKIVPKSPRIALACYACDEQLSVPQRMLGWTIRCKKCKSENKVLEAKEAAFLRRNLESEFLVVEDLRDLAEGTPTIAKSEDPVSPHTRDGKLRKMKDGEQVIRTQSMMTSRSQFVPTSDDSQKPVRSKPAGSGDAGNADPKVTIVASDQDNSCDTGSFIMESISDSSSSINLHIDAADLPYVIVKSTFVPDAPDPSIPARELGDTDTGEISSSANFSDSNIGISDSNLPSASGESKAPKNVSAPEVRVRIVKSSGNSSDIEVDQSLEGPPLTNKSSASKSSASSRWAVDEQTPAAPSKPSTADTVDNRIPSSSTGGSSISSAGVTASQSTSSPVAVGSASPRAIPQPEAASPDNSVKASKSGFKKRKNSKIETLLVYGVAGTIALAFAVSIGWFMYAYLINSRAERPQRSVNPAKVEGVDSELEASD